jgi:hypothetical protein
MIVSAVGKIRASYSLASTIACGQASSSYRKMAALMSPAMTFLSRISDTTYSLTCHRMMVSGDRGLGVTRHDVSVTVSDIQSK